MPGKAVGRAAADLPWLCPNTDSLIGLAENAAALPRLAAADPALLAFLVRFAPAPDAASFSLDPSRFVSAILPETAAAYLGTMPEAVPDGAAPLVAAARGVSAIASEFARRVAVRTGRVSPVAAAATARLAPLGWYAAGVVEPTAGVGQLVKPCSGRRPGPGGDSNTAAPGPDRPFDHDAVARRLAARWRMPPWLGAVLGNLNLPLGAARRVGADADLFAVVQLAVRTAEGRSTDLGLSRGADPHELLTHLRLDEETVAELFTAPIDPAVTINSGLDSNPHRVPLVRNLLRMAGEARRRSGAALVLRYEQRIDELYRAVGEMAAVNAEKLRDAKLAGLAELAAGAGHEINNPLAVISGHAQRLIRTETDPDRADTLRVIVRQTNRVHGILKDLIQFARPTRPERKVVPVSELIAGVCDELAPLAAERGVRFDLSSPADVWLDADPRQLRHAIAAVVRNGIEAAGADGWVRLRVEAADSGPVAFVVEDSGPGLTPAAVEHAFDPFYCGRPAGRGRGLGLPTAWRFARVNGGDVRYAPGTDGVTRFVVTCPRGTPVEMPGRKSA